ncbi:hypothetical protein [Streptomyces sp. NPDC002553]|uniref:hypothetical protein n=1 Tax=Streptomyces sp. NPDC002553 TaxID=3154417 RepID=UPI00333290B2
MHASVLSAVQLTLALGLVAWMMTGFTRLPGRWLRRKMFCRATFRPPHHERPIRPHRQIRPRP